MLSIFLIGIALSMDAFSVSLSIGTTKLAKNRYKLIPITVSIMHFIMPILGYYFGSIITNIVNINPKIIMTIILTYLVFLMKKEKNNEHQSEINNIFSILLFAFSVSIDSFTVGIGLKALTSKIIIPPIVFSLCSGSITYMGLLLGKYSKNLWKEKAINIGILLLLLIIIVNICKLIS